MRKPHVLYLFEWVKCMALYIDKEVCLLVSSFYYGAEEKIVLLHACFYPVGVHSSSKL